MRSREARQWNVHRSAYLLTEEHFPELTICVEQSSRVYLNILQIKKYATH